MRKPWDRDAPVADRSCQTSAGRGCASSSVLRLLRGNRSGGGCACTADTSSRRPVTGTAPGRKPLPRTATWRIVKRKGLPTDHDRATDDVPDRLRRPPGRAAPVPRHLPGASPPTAARTRPARDRGDARIRPGKDSESVWTVRATPYAIEQSRSRPSLVPMSNRPGSVRVSAVATAGTAATTRCRRQRTVPSWRSSPTISPSS